MNAEGVSLKPHGLIQTDDQNMYAMRTCWWLDSINSMPHATDFRRVEKEGKGKEGLINLTW